MPIRTRLTLAFAALMMAALAIAGVLVHRGFAAQLDKAINERLTLLTGDLVSDFEDGDQVVLADFGEGDSEGYLAQILGSDGMVAEEHETGRASLLQAGDPQTTDKVRIFDRIIQAPDGKTGTPARLGVQAAVGGRTVIVGKFLDDREAALKQLALLLWLAGPALGFAASALAWLMSGAALRPVEDLRKKASLISEGSLAQRLPVPRTGDEIAMLARTLNEMLERLERAFERERRFVDDASHELRTPLGVLKTELDLALRRSRTKEELEAALHSAAEESERLNQLAEDLLVLARADRGKLPIKREQVGALAFLGTVAARFDEKARAQNVNLAVSAPADLVINVDTLRMRQAIGNLIANALGHTPRRGRIDVEAAANGTQELVVTVSDSGPGFPSAFIQDAFKPFARADAGRARREGGAGLGLAIVKGVAEAHGGSVTAANRPVGGAIVSLHIPQ